LRTAFVNSRGKPGVCLAQNITILHGKTGEIGSRNALDLPFCLLFLPLCKCAHFMGGNLHVPWAGATLDRHVKETEPRKRMSAHSSHEVSTFTPLLAEKKRT
jgi:hypothetical protein